jgi:PAS domain S-box-containing protein
VTRIILSENDIITDESGRVIRMYGTNQDITERKKAEEALIESEERFRSILDNIQDAYMRADKEGTILMASPSAAHMYRFNSTQEMIGTSTPSYFKNSEDRDYAIEELKKHGKFNDYEVEARRNDGTFFWVSQNAQYYYDDQGKIQGSETFVRDITKRKKAENELQDSKSQFQALIHNLQSGVALVDETGRFAVVNPSFLRMFGLDSELDILNVNSQDWSRWEVYGEDNKLLHVDEHPVRKVALTSKPVKNQLVGVCSPGANRLTWMLVSAEPMLDKDGSISMIICTYYDITERKKAEEELKRSEETARQRAEELETLMDMVPASIFLSEDPYCLSIVGNKEGNRMYEVEHGIDVSAGTTEGEVLSVERRFFKEGKELKPEELPMQMAVKKGEDVLNYAMDALLPSGKMITMFGNASPLFDNNGKVRGCIGVYIDITDLKKAEKALKEAHDNLEGQVEARTVEIEEAYQIVKESEFKLKETITELERSNNELESFAYITSHDLQEPLRSIASYAQLIKRRYEGQLDSDADEFIEFMVGGAKRLQSMIQGLLDYSRVGTQGEEFKDFNTEEALNFALSNLKSSIEECHAEVIYDSLPVVHADGEQISRVFQNLMGNALKFRKEGVQPKIHIKAMKEGNEYIFSVQDNGIGMEKQYSDRIFEVFKRLHPIGEYQGTGIGLAIVKRIVERHGGRIWVESSLGEVSTFYFTIPITEVA